MFLTMQSPPDRPKRTVKCNEAQAEILRKVGWTEVVEKGSSPTHIVIEEPEDVVIEPEPIVEPIRAKRRYKKRVLVPGGTKRNYRRRDMQAEE